MSRADEPDPAADETIRALEAALAQSPDNVPLIRHLARTLGQQRRFEDAERWYRRALQLASDDDTLRLALAECYLDQNKHNHAGVIVDLLLQRDPPVAGTFVLHARILLAEGDVRRAVHAFHRAVEDDPKQAESELARRLGLSAADLAGRSGDDRDEDDAGVPEVVDGRVRSLADEGPNELAGLELERPRIAFADVGGMDALKEEISIKLIQPQKHPELFKAYGKSVGGGLLLYGPPGCGKTHIARATAGEAQARFLAVGIHDVLDMWLGNSEKQLHAIFEHARRNAPCVLFFDEVDALASKRSDMRGSAGRHVINQFLSELDGVSASNEGVLILAATNSPWFVDPAFRRPGRFDRMLFVPPPDETARAAILEVHLAGKPLEALSAAKIVKKLDGFSGADLHGLVERAVEAKLRAALKQGAPSPLTEKDLMRAAKLVKPSTREWFSTARNHVLYANEGGLYDDVAKYLGLE